MTSPEIEYQPEPKKPPSRGLIIATFLELTVAFNFFSSLPDSKAIIGLLSCAAYFWFSASFEYFRYMMED